jgi:shikimate dehydrogenase
LENWLQKYKQLNIIILGDGVMSNVTQQALEKCNIVNFKIFSRKMFNHFDQLNISEIFKTQHPTEGQKIVINTCSRNFIFKGDIDNKTIFWDYNYNFEEHSRSLSLKTQQYIDGLEMLELQARYALAFWSIKSI